MLKICPEVFFLISTNFKNEPYKDFLGSPVVKVLHFYCRGADNFQHQWTLHIRTKMDGNILAHISR